MALSIGDRRLGAILLEQGYVSDNDLQKALDRHSEVGGRLADIAPTVLDLMGLPKPVEMTGESLIAK